MTPGHSVFAPSAGFYLNRSSRLSLSELRSALVSIRIAHDANDTRFGQRQKQNGLRLPPQ
ncbi:MAG: hypothetical protein LBH29_00865 [Elusimicrobiota bacterium]|nr:hypothetical protein [Elusimicrobiota bacterium]